MNNEIKNTPPVTIVSEKDLIKDIQNAKEMSLEEVPLEPYLLPQEYWMEPIKKEIDAIFEQYYKKSDDDSFMMDDQGIEQLKMLVNLHGAYCVNRIVFIKLRENVTFVKEDTIKRVRLTLKEMMEHIPHVNLEDAYPNPGKELEVNPKPSKHYFTRGELLATAAISADDTTLDQLEREINDSRIYYELHPNEQSRVKRELSVAMTRGIVLGNSMVTTHQGSGGHGYDISTNGGRHKKVVTGKAGNRYPIAKRRGVR